PREARAEGDWAEIIRLLPEFGPHGRLAFEYVELFGIDPLRMKSAKILRRLREIARLLREERFTYRKKAHRISRAGIVEALKTVCNKGFESSLSNDNYLKQVMISIAEQEHKKDRDRLDREQREREGRGRSVRPEEDSGNEEPLPAREISRRAGELMDKIGTKA
ncbi:MAG: hypothetical protein PVG49_18000, partial [Desulfobacteraceae bacterium]